MLCSNKRRRGNHSLPNSRHCAQGSCNPPCQALHRPHNGPDLSQASRTSTKEDQDRFSTRSGWDSSRFLPTNEDLVGYPTHHLFRQILFIHPSTNPIQRRITLCLYKGKSSHTDMGMYRAILLADVIGKNSAGAHRLANLGALASDFSGERSWQCGGVPGLGTELPVFAIRFL